jgi:hypothetical protein
LLHLENVALLALSVLNVWVLMNLRGAVSASMDWFNLDPNSTAERQALGEIIEITSDKDRLTGLFPHEALQK